MSVRGQSSPPSLARLPLAILLLPAGCTEPQQAEPGPAVTVSAGVELGEVRDCVSPADRPTWTDVAESRGLLASRAEAHSVGGSTVVDDLDGDGDFDIAVAYVEEMFFYLRESDGYTTLPLSIQGEGRLLTVGELGLGRPQVLIGGSPAEIFDIVEGAPTRRDIVEHPDPKLVDITQAVYPHDLNNDGHPDLFAISPIAELQDDIHWGLGDGYFEVDATALPEDVRYGRGFGARWFDYDLDRDLDLYVVRDMGETYGANVLYENDDGKLVDASEGCGCALATSCMGVDVGDFSGDGWPDLYVTVAGKEVLLQGTGDGSFVDVTRATGIPAQPRLDMGWGGVFVDLENDGDLDIFEARGDLWFDAETGNVADTTPRFLENEGGIFSETAAEWGLDVLGSWRSVVPWDDNGDGVVDLLMTHVTDRPVLWLSDSCTAAGWLEVAAPIGAQVVIEAGGRTQTSWVTAQSAVGGSKPPIVRFGLGEAALVDRLEVTGMDGQVWLVEAPFEARRRVTITP